MRLYLFLQAISRLGSAITAFAFPLMMAELTHSASATVSLMVVSSIAKLCFGPMLAAFFENRDKRRGLFATDIIRGLALLSCVFITSANAWLLFLIAFITGTGDSAFNVLETVSAPILGKAQAEEKSLAAIEFIAHFSGLIGPAIGGAIIALTQPKYGLVVDGVTFLVSAVGVQWLPPLVSRTTSSVRANLSILWKQPTLFWLLSATVFAMLGIGPFNALYVFYFRDTLHLSRGDIASLEMVYAVGGMLGTWAAAQTYFKRFNVYRLMAVGSFFCAVSAMGIALADSLRAIAFFQCAFGFFCMFPIIFFRAETMRQLPMDLRTRGMAVRQMLADAMEVIGRLLLVFVVTPFGPRAALFICCIPLLLRTVSPLLADARVAILSLRERT